MKNFSLREKRLPIIELMKKENFFDRLKIDSVALTMDDEGQQGKAHYNNEIVSELRHTQSKGLTDKL